AARGTATARKLKAEATLRLQSAALVDGGLDRSRVDMRLHHSWPDLCEGQERLREATCLLVAITLLESTRSRERSSQSQSDRRVPAVPSEPDSRSFTTRSFAW